MTKEEEMRKEIKQVVDKIPTEDIEDRIKQDEQEEAIERLNIHKDYAGLSNGVVFVNKTDIETVLNMLKEKDKEIEKKNNIINLMAKYINYLSDELVQATGKNELEFCNGNICCKDSNYSCEQCIKQYFERKASE